ncbi:MAG: hypothetical protein K8R87_01405 [Verrucomicrobia bacterium]|nr:hypothetical protein [Verrucomicrobiota bacterium]
MSLSDPAQATECTGADSPGNGQGAVFRRLFVIHTEIFGTRRVLRLPDYGEDWKQRPSFITIATCRHIFNDGSSTSYTRTLGD